MGWKRRIRVLINDSLISSIITAAITIFAPSDEAFQGATLPTANDLVELLKYHVIGASVQSSGITNNLMSDTLSTGTKIRFNIYDTVRIFFLKIKNVFLNIEFTLIQSSIILHGQNINDVA